jgi:large subunit ribosomal protein L31
MKKGIHPSYHPVHVTMTDGSQFITQTTWGESGAKLQLVIDPKNHPAYTGERKIVDTMGRMEKFRMKYGQGTKVAAATAVAEATEEEAAAE